MIVRLLLFALVLLVLYVLIKKMINPSDTITCSRCDGKGFWYGARGKEKCDWCKGSGRLYRNT